MKRFGWQWLVISSVLATAMAASGQTRPQYGGTLEVEMRTAPSSLDPADRSQAASFDRRNLTWLLFDSLVSIDENGRIQPSLAESWQRSNRRWQFRLRGGVQFHDGSPLTAEIAAASLKVANPEWNVSAEGDSVAIEDEGSGARILTELALPRNAIVKRDSSNGLSGTGPFRLVNWQAGKKLVLAAAENHWRGRPFLDGVEIEMGRSFRDQVTALELKKTDLAEIAPEQTQRMPSAKYRIAHSAPIELVALVFARDASSPEEKSLREALALSVERGSMRSVLLQGSGQPTAGILPTWISGYDFVFPAEADLAKARQLRGQARAVPNWTLAFDGDDSLSHMLAERIALNARDAGLLVQPTPASTGDMRLMRIPLSSPDGWTALNDFAASCGLASAKSKGNSVEELYAAEQAMLATERVIPLFHLPVTYASSLTLQGWMLRPDGSWDVSSAWMKPSQP